MMGVPELLTPDNRHRLSREAVAAAPHIRWNAFLDIISANPSSFPIGLRRQASLAFLYESEVQNGGHDQYFANTRGEHAQETVFALRALGDNCRAQILAQAHAASGGGTTEIPSRFDDEFHRCKPELIEVLSQHLQAHESLYIEWVA